MFEIATLISFILGVIGASGVVLSWIRKPDIEVSEINATFSNPYVRGGTILLQRNTGKIIPAIYGSVIVKNEDSLFSEPLRSCGCEIRVMKNGDELVDAVGAWDEEGKRTLEKEVNIKKGSSKQLHIFRVILEPSEKSSYDNFQEGKATSFPILNIDETETPAYQSSVGNIWIEMPEMIEAAFGGWRAKKEKLPSLDKYEIVLKLKGENLDQCVKEEINFQEWLKDQDNYWQENWLNNARPTVNKAVSLIESI